MKIRHEGQKITDRDEQETLEQLRGLVTASSIREPEPPPQAYWGNLLVRTNQRIDEATSGKALSLSWLGRVAIPGVLSILSFFLALHYYVPDEPRNVSSMTSLINQLPDETIDSLLIEHPKFAETYASNTLLDDPIEQLSGDQITDYFISTGYTSSLLETMSDQQVNELVQSIGSMNN